MRPLHRNFAGWLVFLVVMDVPREALAGMPTITLTDIARARLQVISFFLMVLLLCAWAVKGIWNSLRLDFPRLPRLSFGKACGLVGLWGLLFLLVLTMISGARELLTPGAWEKTGQTYRLAHASQPNVVPLPDHRLVKIEQLRAALWAYARQHDGRFPPDHSPNPEIPEDAWRVPDASGMRYVYIPGRRAGDEGDSIVAFEPVLYGVERYVLRASGQVERLPFAKLHAILHGTPAPEERP